MCHLVGPMFKVALVGHSQVSTALDLPDGIELSIFRSPGAKARTFFRNPRLTRVLRNKYDLVILWLGSNDIKPSCRVREIVQDLKAIVVRLELGCASRVKVCLIEPRHPDRREPLPVVDQETYDKVRKGINNNLQKRALKGKEFITFGARPYERDLGNDGIHFNLEGQARIVQKFVTAITHAYAFQPEQHWGASNKE